jgi:hypothetical protein
MQANQGSKQPASMHEGPGHLDGKPRSTAFSSRSAERSWPPYFMLPAARRDERGKKGVCTCVIIDEPRFMRAALPKNAVLSDALSW